ncbi:cytochrome P450 [Epithele typhae]|uniref:cytochrome P450 n=1 Tax=Epithele typhae TaxID=378194 RepID=UPI002008B902|nr:cytochrome P450 [Epithele typhae]KAH9930522.1 cytochrome P450 [Epithele typhae]
MSCISPVLPGVIVAALSITLLARLFKQDSKPFPGPIGLPFFGVAFQIPDDKQWLKFHDWTCRYGDVVGVTVMGQPTLVLGSFRAANDLLDARGAIYSDRPDAVMAGELVGWNRGLGYAHGPEQARFREFRRLFQHAIGPRACADPAGAVVAMQYAETRRLLLRFARDPRGFFRHARESTGALILRLAYGYVVARDQAEDPLVHVVEVAMQGFAGASEPGAFLVDYFPALRRVPEWLLRIPRGERNFKAVARRMRQELDEMYDLPFAFVKGQMTPSSINAFILAITLNPHIQTRAQAELDALLGAPPTRLPTLEDRPALPYVSAIVLEVLRWNPAVPLGLAHRLTRDDVYRGRPIKAGTVVWANIWSMLQDPAVFPEPHAFRPERFLDASGRLRELERHEDPSVVGFGFGRRDAFAMNSVFLGIASLLYTFEIKKRKDERGVEVVPEVDFRGFISHPIPFECDIKPRSEGAASMINRLAAQV